VPRVLTTKDFTGPTLPTAQQLLGVSLCRRLDDGQILRMPITETEAYDGPEDLACHAAKGRTARTEVMFGPAGVWYVYLCYGVHWLANLVVGPPDYPAAILLRGAGDLEGPGRLTKRLGVTGPHFNGKTATKATGLWLEAPATPLTSDEVVTTARIGVGYAGDWTAARYRFVWRAQWAGGAKKLARQAVKKTLP